MTRLPVKLKRKFGMEKWNVQQYSFTSKQRDILVRLISKIVPKFTDATKKFLNFNRIASTNQGVANRHPLL